MTKEQISFKAAQRGYITALESALMGGCLALSQRVGEWKRQGCLIGDKWVITKGGAKVKAYRVLRAAKKVA